MKGSIFNVLTNDYCIGCGGCAYIEPNFKIEFDDFGMYKAVFNNQKFSELIKIAEKICPFSDKSLNEDQISDIIFEEVINKDINIGKYLANYAGYVKEGDFREKGSSGGFGKWILNDLLKNDLVDYVLQVVNDEKSSELFSYKVFSKDDDILCGARSVYYPVTLEDALKFIKKNKGRYAITALPCFSKTLRNIALHDNIIANRLKYIIGIVCGHLKSKAFAELFAWQLGVPPNELKKIEFRDKIPGLKANEKGVYAINKNGYKTTIKSSKTLCGGNWGHGLFKYKGCEFCDDVMAETADVSVGDAWLEEYINDPLGNNVLVVRNYDILELIKKGIENEKLEFNDISIDKIIQSQAGGFRNKREGLSFRLDLANKNKNWVAKKRDFNIKNVDKERKRIYKKRMEISKTSHKLFVKAKKKSNLNFFLSKMHRRTETLAKTSLQYNIENKLYKIYHKLKNM